MTIRALNPNRKKIEANFSKAFCATLPSEREVLELSKAFCATLPGEPDPTELAKSFCATLPSEKTMYSKTSELLKSRLKKPR